MSLLAFSRNKIVGVESPEPGILVAHGILDDPVYGLEVDVTVSLPGLTISRIEGRMKRFTTPECPRSVPALQNAVGLSIHSPDFISRVNRVVGREGCRHFANLVAECGDALMQAVAYAGWTGAGGADGAPDKAEFLRQRAAAVPGLANSCMAFSSSGLRGSPERS